ncbi:MAG: hypothetical protein ACE5H4_09235 [Candidatus Thorarchaeota archaeon]
MTETPTPEERLRRYKEYLASLHSLANNGRPLDSRPTPNISNSAPKSAPVKKELVDALAVLVQSKGKNQTGNAKKSPKKNVILKVKERAIESSLQEIRDERRLLERKLDRGVIDQAEYERQIQKLVKRGQALLREQALVTDRLNGKP